MAHITGAQVGGGGLHTHISQPLASDWKQCSQNMAHITGGHALQTHISQPLASVWKPCSQNIAHMTGGQALQAQTSQPLSSVLNPYGQDILHFCCEQITGTLTAPKQEWPQPLEQHFCEAEQSLSEEHSSMQMPTDPDGTRPTGHSPGWSTIGS